MPIPDLDDEKNDRFEAYLNQFRPLAVEPLPLEKPNRSARRQFVFTVWAATAAAIILAAVVLAMYPRNGRPNSSDGPGNLASVAQHVDTQPRTIGSANALLAHAPSVEAVFDRVPFHPPSTQLPQGKQSALAVLSEDIDKL